MYKELLTICLFAVFSFLSVPQLSAQPPVDEDQYEKDYQKRIKKDYLYGVYIPKDLADAFTQLNRLVDDPSKRKFVTVADTTAARKLHFSLGRWLIHNWGFYGGSRFSAYLKSVGIYHPDDMASFVIIAYHRYLTKQPLEVKALVQYFTEYREQEKDQRLQNAKILHQEIRKRPKPDEDGEQR